MKRVAILGGAALAAIAFSIRGRSPSQKRIPVGASISSEGSLATRPGKSADGSAEPEVPTGPNRPPLPPADDNDAGPALAGVGFDPDDKAAEAIARVINNRVRSNLARDRRVNAAVTQHIAEAIEATVLEAVADGLPQIERAIVRYHTLTRSSIERRRLDAIKARQAARTSAAIEELDGLQ